jgi:hypothetical protein
MNRQSHGLLFSESEIGAEAIRRNALDLQRRDRSPQPAAFEAGSNTSFRFTLGIA